MLSTRIVLIACLSAGMGAVAAGEAVTREEFQKFVDEVAKLRAENAEIKTENAELKKEMTKISTSATASAADLEKELDTFVTIEEFKPLKEIVSASKPGTTKMLLTGSAFTTFSAPQHSNSSFVSEFDPIFLWKMSDRLSFEAEIPISVENNDTAVELEYADIAYVVNDYLTVQAGKFKSPFGLFNMRFDPAWINKMSDPPMIYDDGAECLVPHEQVGVMGIGATDICSTKLRYAAFVSNGLRVEPSDPATFGQLLPHNNGDNNNDKGVGGRIGFLPIWGVELGASAEYSANVSDFSAATKRSVGVIYGFDLSMNRDFKPILGTIDFKAEYVNSKVGNNTYTLTTDPVSTVAFNHNHRSGSYVQVAYRPILVKQKYVKNFEWVARYDHLSNPNPTAGTPPDALFQRSNHDRWSVGLNYYLEPSTVLKADYEHDSHSGHTITLQYAIGF